MCASIGKVIGMHAGETERKSFNVIKQGGFLVHISNTGNCKCEEFLFSGTSYVVTAPLQ